MTTDRSTDNRHWLISTDRMEEGRWAKEQKKPEVGGISKWLDVLIHNNRMDSYNIKEKKLEVCTNLFGLSAKNTAFQA